MFDVLDPRRIPLAFGLALVAALPGPRAAGAQTGGQTQQLPPGEAEALDMSLDLAFACSPRRHNQATGSESIIRRESESLGGTAVFVQTAEGTFLVFEEYDEQYAGHCMVLGWFGGQLEAGRYEIRQLAYDTMEEEVGADRPSFFGMGVVRAGGENSLMVTLSGTVELETVEPGRITGRFDLLGFSVEGNERQGGIAWSGTFVALEGEA